MEYLNPRKIELKYYSTGTNSRANGVLWGEKYRRVRSESKYDPIVRFENKRVMGTISVKEVLWLYLFHLGKKVHKRDRLAMKEVTIYVTRTRTSSKDFKDYRLVDK